MDRQQHRPQDNAPQAWEMSLASHSVGMQADRGAPAQQLLFTSAATHQLEEDHVQPPAVPTASQLSFDFQIGIDQLIARDTD
eukprot:3339179-Rhodomonas_salina.1